MGDGGFVKFNESSAAETAPTEKSLLLNKKTNQTILHFIPHEYLTGFNCTDDHTLENLRFFPECSISYPRSVYISPSLPKKIDPCHRRSRAHWNHFSTLRRYQSYLKAYEKKKDYKKAVKEGIYPGLLVRFTELLELNPDPYFSGRYDWYYTGGNLDVVDGRNLVIHVSGNDIDTLAISEVLNDTTQQLLTPIVMNINDSEKHKEIFEIQTIESTPEVVFSVRRKNKISIYTYDDNNLECNYSFTQADVPYISSASDPHQRNLFVTSDLEKVVCLWDVKKSTTKPIQILFNSNNESDEKDQNWNCVRNFDRDTYVFAGMHEFTLLDTRVPFDRTTHKLRSFENAYEYCERISSMCTSEYKNLVYIGTSHKMFAVDMRYIGKEVEDKNIVIRWTHQMDMSPIILRAFRKDNYELVISTSPISGDVRYYENIVDTNCRYTSPCLPFMPPSLLDAYNNARVRGYCLNPTALLKNRIASCTTGMNFIKQDGEFFALFSNSNGDVFSQNITLGQHKAPVEEKSAIVMDKWEKDSVAVKKSLDFKLTATKVDDFSGMRKVFRCKRLDNARQKTFDEPKRPHQLLKWQRPIQDLYEYKDALVSDLLSIWDFDLDEKNEINIEIETEEPSGKGRVEEWLNHVSEIVNEPPMVSVSNTSFRNITQNTEHSKNLYDNASIQSENVAQSLIYAKPKHKANESRRSKYVQGF